jgi:S1-C subfamily serine protease
MALLPGPFLDAVVSIGIIQKDLFRALATGFLFGLNTGVKNEKGDLYKVFLVTNRHVFINQKMVVLRFNLTASGSKTYNLPLMDDKGDRLWLAHANEEVDVAAIQINVDVLKNDGIKHSFIPEEHTAFLETIKTEGITQGDSVFVLGFPMGIAGIEKNYAIVKGGIISRLDDEIINSEHQFYIDANIFPGNSGGPVFSKPEIVSIGGTKAVNRAYLIGVVSGYIAYQEEAISKQTGETRVVFVENSGIGRVVPMDFVRETVQSLMESIKKTQDPKAETGTTGA